MKNHIEKIKIKVRDSTNKIFKKKKTIDNLSERKYGDGLVPFPSAPKKKKKKKNWFFRIVSGLLLLFFVCTILGIIGFFYMTKDLPRPKDFTDTEFNQSTKIYDYKGEVLLSSVYGEEKRTYVPLSKIPKLMQKAVIATEDANFYEHHGFDIKAMARAIRDDLITRSPNQGASTITQQLIRATFLTAEKTITRKVKEILLATELDRKYSKDQILEWYLNKVPFGINLYGIEETSLTYFEKPAQELNLAECAILAASIQSPSYYSPYGSHLDVLLERKNYVLKRMEEEGYITSKEKEEAEKYEFKFAKVQKNVAYHFVEYVKSILEEKYGPGVLETKGLKIYTTLDWDMQKAAEQIVKEGAIKNRKSYGAYNAAMIVMDPKTGEVRALVGSADAWGDSLPAGCTPGKNCLFESWMNIPVQSERQPGSSFKPIVYAQAFEKGATADSIVVDEPTDFGGGYRPNNFDMSFRGAITLRTGLAQSLNIPAIKTLRDYAGLQDTMNLAKKMGISTLTRDANFYGLPFALGGADVKMIDMASAFSVFANGGYAIPSSAIIKIVDSKGEVIYKNDKTPRKVLSENTCNTITSILSDNVARAPMFGENSVLRFDDYRVAVKTGTTQNSVDGWTIGYTADAVVVVWAGNNDRTPIVGAIGEMTAAPMWRKAIEKSIQIFNTKPIYSEEANPWDGLEGDEKTQKIKELLEELQKKQTEEQVTNPTN